MKKETINEYLERIGFYEPLSDEYAYEMYKNCFPYINFRTYKMLDKRGMLGKLWKGLRIELPKDNVIVEECTWRKMVYEYTGRPAPMFGCNPKL